MLHPVIDATWSDDDDENDDDDDDDEDDVDDDKTDPLTETLSASQLYKVLHPWTGPGCSYDYIIVIFEVL